MFRFLSVGIALSFLPLAGIAQNLTGRVVNVHDGDTLTLLIDRKQIRVRLLEIDAPESKQAFGRKSKDSLAEMCAGKTAQVESTSRDRYGRVLGWVTCESKNANAEQVRRGMAWVFDRYAKADSPLYLLQEEARATNRGLWADMNPVPPWEWRRTQ
jgi:endonuclease YncB( thermonuclease family)